MLFIIMSLYRLFGTQKKEMSGTTILSDSAAKEHAELCRRMVILDKEWKGLVHGLAEERRENLLPHGTECMQDIIKRTSADENTTPFSGLIEEMWNLPGTTRVEMADLEDTPAIAFAKRCDAMYMAETRPERREKAWEKITEESNYMWEESIAFAEKWTTCVIPMLKDTISWTDAHYGTLDMEQYRVGVLRAAERVRMQYYKRDWYTYGHGNRDQPSKHMLTCREVDARPTQAMMDDLLPGQCYLYNNETHVRALYTGRCIAYLCPYEWKDTDKHGLPTKRSIRQKHSHGGEGYNFGWTTREASSCSISGHMFIWVTEKTEDRTYEMA